MALPVFDAHWGYRTGWERYLLEEILGETCGGTIVSDFFSAYTKYANKLQQFCLAHLIRNIKVLSGRFGRGQQLFLQRFHATTSDNHSFGREVDQPHRGGSFDQGYYIINAEFAHDVIAVHFDCLFRAVEDTCGLLIAITAQDMM